MVMRVLPIVIALVLAGCSGTESASADPQTVDGRTFVSVAVDGDQIPGGGPLTVGFDGDRISTFAGCNRGAGTADLADGHIAAQLAMTMMACPPPAGDADAWMSKFFDARPSWTLDGDTLTLRTDAATVTLQDRKVLNPDRPLTGTTWQVHSLVSDQAVTTSVAIEQAKPSLTIAPDGTVTGTTGCNRFNGHAEVSGSGDAVDFGPLAVTKMACAGEIGEIEQAVLRVLTGHVTAAVDADQLRLTRDDGYGLVLRSQG
ncbi:lipoprotein [Mycolicibacterium mageritense DSM 44476 = CIP 104973]